MSRDRTEIEEQALAWVISLRAPDFEQWDAFGAWMSADPRHAETYHEMAIADQDMAGILAAPVPKPIMAAAPGRVAGRRLWIGSAVAASLVAVIGFPLIDREPALYRIETRPGEYRTVQLAEGSSVRLNGGTRVALDRDNPRHVELEQGEAVFAVVHDEAKPFEVIAGDATLLDVGTRFNVVRDAGVTSVQVAEGAVVYNPDRQAVRLDPGHTLRVADGKAPALGLIRPALVASWETGQLIYDARPIEEVVADLSRWSGRKLRLSPQLAGKTFSGAIDLRSTHDIADLAPILDVKIEKVGDGWTLSPRG